MNFFTLILGYLGVCASEFILVRNALLKGSGETKFMLRHRAYWIALLIILAPLGGIVSSLMVMSDGLPLIPVLFNTPTQPVILQSIFYGGAFVAILSGVKFKDVQKMEVNDLQGHEGRLSVKQALRWYFSR